MARNFIVGSSEDIRFGTNSSSGLDLSLINWSFTAWVRPTSFIASHRGLLGTFISDQMYGVSLINGELSVHIINIGDAVAHASPNPALNVWTHIGVDVGASQAAPGIPVRYWVAGAAAGTTTMGSQAATPGRFTNALGVRQNDLWYDGDMADVAIWGTLLDSADYLALAQGASEPRAIKLNSLLYYAPLCGVSSPEPDLGPRALTGTLAGTRFAANPPIPSVCNKGVQLSRVAGRGMRW